MPITRLKHISESDLDRAVWRYLTFPKYISLLSYGALWFCKLNILQDKFEGAMPTIANQQMFADHQRFKKLFAPALHDQIDNMNEKNVDDGRELTIVNCWYAGENESKRMWELYAPNRDGVAIKSTIRRLSQHVFCDSRLSSIGLVQYVDLAAHEMSLYEANQAQERAFLKRAEFSHECEVRVSTMSIKGPMCVNMDGNPVQPSDYEGANMNNFENPGIYIRADLRKLITETVIAPKADSWFEMLVKKIAREGNVGLPVVRSSLD